MLVDRWVRLSQLVPGPHGAPPVAYRTLTSAGLLPIRALPLLRQSQSDILIRSEYLNYQLGVYLTLPIPPLRI